ncbi:MAG: hypothetical protein LBP98_07745 [Tannerella sp.]|jgi:hypothetical protein|nr:hypothetical protein [Tannerella sp.]
MNGTNGIQNQETRVEANAQGEVQAAAAQPQSGNSPEAGNTDKAGRIKQAAMGVGGVVAGAAGAAVVMGFVVPDDPPPGPASPGDSQPAGPSPSVADFDGSEVPAASHVNDDMSFTEAFASARQETGPGGVFFWRGGVYGTYYRDEWNHLSPEYREVFSNYPYPQPENTPADAGTAAAATETGAGVAAEQAHATDTAEQATAATGNPSAAEAVETGTGVAAEQAHATDTAEQATAATGNPPAAEAEQVQADVMPAQADDTASAEVLGVQYVDVEGQTMAVAPITVDGHNTLLVDVDTDGVFDYALADNGTPEPEVLDISEHQITHGDAAVMQQAQQQVSDAEDNYLESNHLPDYTNDASAEQYTNA